MTIYDHSHVPTSILLPYFDTVQQPTNLRVSGTALHKHDTYLSMNVPKPVSPPSSPLLTGTETVDLTQAAQSTAAALPPFSLSRSTSSGRNAWRLHPLLGRERLRSRRGGNVLWDGMGAG